MEISQPWIYWNLQREPLFVSGLQTAGTKDKGQAGVAVTTVPVFLAQVDGCLRAGGPKTGMSSPKTAPHLHCQPHAVADQGRQRAAAEWFYSHFQEDQNRFYLGWQQVLDQPRGTTTARRPRGPWGLQRAAVRPQAASPHHLPASGRASGRGRQRGGKESKTCGEGNSPAPRWELCPWLSWEIISNNQH